MSLRARSTGRPEASIPERPALAADFQAALLPQDVVLLQGRQLRDAHTGVEQRQNDQLFQEGLTGIRQPVDFVVGQRLVFVLPAGPLRPPPDDLQHAAVRGSPHLRQR